MQGRNYHMDMKEFVEIVSLSEYNAAECVGPEASGFCCC